MSAATKGKLLLDYSLISLYNRILLGIFIVSAKRTAFGTFGGAFKNTSATQLQTVAAKAAISAAGLKPEQIDTVNIGNVLPVSGNSPHLAGY